MAQLFLTSGLVGDKWSASLSGRFTLGTHWIGDRLGPQSRSGRCGEETNLLPLPGTEPQFVHPVACYYTD
jgi:hypothetical protein